MDKAIKMIFGLNRFTGEILYIFKENWIFLCKINMEQSYGTRLGNKADILKYWLVITLLLLYMSEDVKNCTRALASVAQWNECWPAIQGSLVLFPVRANAWVVDQVSSRGAQEATTHWCFSPSLPSL